jgi:hypothetical protein
MKRTEIQKEFRKTTGFAPRLERNFVPDLEKAFPKTFRNECDLREIEREKTERWTIAILALEKSDSY